MNVVAPIRHTLTTYVHEDYCYTTHDDDDDNTKIVSTIISKDVRSIDVAGKLQSRNALDNPFFTATDSTRASF
jgi:hypothetical protein